MSEELLWQLPMVQLLRRLPSIVDNKRGQVEEEAQLKYTQGVHDDDLLEAIHRMIVDLLDSGHTPSRFMLHMISGELKAAWWPERKQHQRSKELAFLSLVQQAIKHQAVEKYGKARDPCDPVAMAEPPRRAVPVNRVTKARDPVTRAEQDIADMLGLSVEGLRRKRTRIRERLKEHEAVLQRQRKRPLRKK
jgi:hypothetical protein